MTFKWSGAVEKSSPFWQEYPADGEWHSNLLFPTDCDDFFSQKLYTSLAHRIKATSVLLRICHFRLEAELRAWAASFSGTQHRMLLMLFSFLLCFLLGLGSIMAAGETAESAPDAGGPDSSDPSGMTADELLAEAEQQFNAANWRRAGALYGAFLENYGEAPEVASRLPMLRYRLAVSLLQVKDFSGARPAMEAALAAQPSLEAPLRQELTFWLGICQMQEDDHAGARKTLEDFIALFPNPQLQSPLWRMRHREGAKIPEARLLIGATYLLEENYLAAVDYLQEYKAGLSPENQGRATILQLYGLLSAGAADPAARERALDLVVEQFPQIGSLTQLAAFQTMTLQLGASFLEQGQYRKAIRCLQRIWPAERILRHQESRLEELKTRLEALNANPRSDAYEKFLLQQMITKVERELANFRTIQDFDAALRLRLASAYQAMDRFREAALILEDMLARMEPSPIVESASINLVQCWNAIARYDRVIASAERFEEVFPQSSHLPLVLYLRGLAEQQAEEYEAAWATFERIRTQFPESEFAARSLFMIGFTALLAEDNERAIRSFTEFPAKYPGHTLTEPAHYWLGMAYSLAEQSDRCREVLADYLEKYPQGSFRGAATFRRAYAAQQLMDFATSTSELQSFLTEYPGHENEAEARILLADALMHNGYMEEGLATLAAIPPEQTRFYEEGIFKAGKALKAMEEWERLKEHMLRFRTEYPRSPRVAEAIFHAGDVLRKQGDEEAARALYWDAIAEFAPDAASRSVEDLFPAVLRLYPGEDGARQYLTRVRDLREKAASRLPEGEKLEGPLLLRTLWAEALALQKTDPQAARLLLLDAARQADPRTTSSQLLADFADARLEIGDEPGALQLYADLIKWHPRAPQKDRALAELGLVELQRGRPLAAQDHFQRFRRETVGSRQTGRVFLALARLQAERGETAEAIATLEELLASEATSGQEKAQALFQIGEIHMAAGAPQKAIPYYQRLYIMHGRWRDWVARAYWRSGEAFEKLSDTEAARRTYAELLDASELSEFPETELARIRLEKLGGRLPADALPGSDPGPHGNPAPAPPTS